MISLYLANIFYSWYFKRKRQSTSPNDTSPIKDEKKIKKDKKSKKEKKIKKEKLDISQEEN